MFWTAFLKRPSTGQAAPAAQGEAQASQDASPLASSSGPKSFEKLEGFDLGGDTFEIHEEPEPQTAEPEPN